MNVKAKGINENVVAGIKYKQYKNGLCDQNIWGMKWVKYKAKIIGNLLNDHLKK